MMIYHTAYRCTKNTWKKTWLRNSCSKHVALDVDDDGVEDNGDDNEHVDGDGNDDK